MRPGQPEPVAQREMRLPLDARLELAVLGQLPNRLEDRISFDFERRQPDPAWRVVRELGCNRQAELIDRRTALDKFAREPLQVVEFRERDDFGIALTFSKDGLRSHSGFLKRWLP